MENTNAKVDSANTVVEENSTNHNNITNVNENGDSAAVNCPRRTPFADLSQVDADLALARTLQEQERAYMMLRMGSGFLSNRGSFNIGIYTHEDDFDEDNYDDYSEDDNNNASDVEVDDDESDVHAFSEREEENLDGELDPSDFPNDEAYARALQDAEDRVMAAELLALARINENTIEEDEDEVDEEDHGVNPQDAWEEVDPDELSYEELLALGEVIGTESRGLSADTIASLPSINYKLQGAQEGTSDSCVICRLDYEDGDNLIVLSCKHSYHSECINNWLQINKVCPVCNAEVSISGS